MCGNKDTQYTRIILYFKLVYSYGKGWEAQNKRDENEDLLGTHQKTGFHAGQ